MFSICVLNCNENVQITNRKVTAVRTAVGFTLSNKIPPIMIKLNNNESQNIFKKRLSPHIIKASAIQKILSVIVFLKKLFRI